MNTLGLFAQVLWYESWQNLPTMAGFVLAAWLWVHGYRKSVVALLLVGAVLSGVLIEVLEPYKVANTVLAFTPSPFAFTREVVGNMIAFIVSTSLGLVYTQVRWSNRRTDILVGVALGLLMATVQGISFLSDQSNTFSMMRTITHTSAFVISGPFALLLVRLLKQRPFGKMLLGAVMLTIALSLIITVVDYGPYLW